jgi:hypothetical protein
MKACIWVFVVWVALCLAVRLAHCTDLSAFSDFDARLIQFNHVWGDYYRQHFNCPKDSTNFTQCQPNTGTVDYSGFVHVAHEGLKLFAPTNSNSVKP